MKRHLIYLFPLIILFCGCTPGVSPEPDSLAAGGLPCSDRATQSCVEVFLGTWAMNDNLGVDCDNHEMIIRQINCTEVEIENVCESGLTITANVTCPACFIQTIYNNDPRFGIGTRVQFNMTPNGPNSVTWDCVLQDGTFICFGNATR